MSSVHWLPSPLCLWSTSLLFSALPVKGLQFFNKYTFIDFIVGTKCNNNCTTTCYYVDGTHQMHWAQRKHGPWMLSWHDCLYRYCLQIDCCHFSSFFVLHSNDETRFNLHLIRLRYGRAPTSCQTPVTHMNTGPTGATKWFELCHHLFVSTYVWVFFSSPLLGTSRELVISTVIESWMIMAWLFGENWSL